MSYQPQFLRSISTVQKSWPMRRAVRDGLTNVLLVISLLFLLGPIAAAGFGWLDGCDFLVKFCVFPGGLIVGGIVYLVEGCVEYYADVLPPKYRQRASQETSWHQRFADDNFGTVTVALEEFAVSNGFRREDALQFHPDDHLWQLFGDFYPDKRFPECLDAACGLSNVDDPSSTTAAVLLRSNATMSEYVRAGLEKSHNAPTPTLGG